MLEWLKKLIGRGITVDGIVQDFSKVVDNLVAHAEKKAVEVGKQTDRITKAEDRRQAAIAEQDKAQTVAQKIRDLLSA